MNASPSVSSREEIKAKNMRLALILASVVAVFFLPPTMVSSIYGMNFHHMPELDWIGGYPMALGIMLLCAVIPYIYFRKKGWL